MKKVFVKFLLCFGMVLCFFTSCEIGLGAQVDVEPPSVVMESPTENARTRKTVTFSGTWTDDLEIKQVTVELKKTTELTDVKESFSFIANTTNNGDDKTKGTWCYCLDTEAANIPDGAYTVIATAEDTYGHTNQVSTVITIDNTPPLIVLESPSTTEISSPMSYGKTFSIIGRGADEQNGGTVDSIDAVIYDENNVEIARKTFTNISTSIDFKIADWDEESEQGNNFYKTIYGTDENAGTKNYYVELIAYDDARKVPAEEGDRGNSTNIIYLNNTLSLIDGYKPSVAYNILNRSASSDSESALEKALKDKANQINKLTFSLNPVNNPYFEVQGYESLGTTANLEDERYSFLNKNKLTVNVYVGRDNKQIRPETVGIYLKPCDVNGNVTGSSKVTLLEPGAISSSGAITDKAVYTEEFKYSSASCTWTSKSLDVETIDGLEIGKYYKVNVSAQDYNNVNIRNSNNYALKITTVNSAPIIIINEPGASLTIAKSAAYTVKGVVKTSSKITKIRLYKNEFIEANYQKKEYEKEYVVNASETINDSGVAALKDKIVLNTSQTTVSQRYYNFSFEVEGISDSDYTLVVVAFDDNNQYAQKEISIENDVNDPTFDDSPTITPLVSSSINEDTGGGKYTVNGTINIAELISDDKKVVGSWWSASDTMPDATKDEGWNAGNLDGSSATNLKFSIDTTQFTDKSKKIIHLKAKDASGNIATDSSVITLYVDQSTDAPVVELSNTNANTNQAAKDYPELDYNNEWNEEAYLAAKQSPNRTVFGTKSNNEMLGTISDDDGIESVEVYYQQIELKTTENGENKLSLKDKNPITLDTIPNKKTTYSLKAKMPSDQGTYLITIKVKDSKQDNTGYNSTTIGPFLIAVDDGAPKLKIETASGGFKPSKFSVSGTIDDPYATLKRYTDEACSQNEKTITINSNCTWVDEIEVDTENNIYTYYYKAEDDYNQSSIESFSFKYDKKAPVFMVESVNGDKIESTNSQTQTELLKYGTIDGTYFMITGLVSDFFYTTESEPSKENVLYEYDNKDNNETDKENNEDDKENNYNKYLEQNENTASGFSESDFYYYVGKTELVKTEADTSYDITKDGWSTCKVSPLDPAGYIGKWTVSINFKELGCENSDIRYIYFAAKDSAGNVSIIDNKIPVIKIVIDSESPKITGSTITVQEKPVIKVSATDNIKINTGKLSVYNNNALMTASKGEYEYTTTSSTDDESKKTTVTFEITLTSVPVGKNKYKVEVVDEAGNKATVDDITIENKAPVISSKNTGIADGAYKIEKDGKSYEYITGIITTSAVITCSGANNKLDSVSWKDEYQKAGEENESVIVELSSGICEPNVDREIIIKDVSGDFSEYENKYVTRTVTATNIFGQSTQWSYHFILDKTAPQINVNEIKLNDVEYSQISNKWYKTDTLKLYGTVTEEGSGVNIIEYELKNGENDNALKGTIYASDQGKFESIISGFTETEENHANNIMTLKVSDKAGNKSVEKSFMNVKIDTTAPVLSEKKAPDGDENETSQIWYRFNGESEWKKLENSILTNKTKDVELTGAFEDKNEKNLQSGVREIKINVNGSADPIFAKVYTYTKAEDKWTVPNEGTGFEPNSNNDSPQQGQWFATVSKNVLGDSGDYSATISIKDNAGNEGGSGKISFRVDTTPPTVTIEMPSVGAKLNGLNTFSGKVNDANDVKSIKLYYAFAETDTAPTTFEKYQELATNVQADTKTLLEKVVGENNVSLSDVTSWKFEEVDVNKILSSEKVKGNLFILPVAYDKAGNCSVDTTSITKANCKQYTVDLNSDRPVITFQNLPSASGAILKYTSQLTGTITDDDGVKTLKIANQSEKPTDWSKIAVVSNPTSFNYNLGVDGSKTLWFYVEDTAGGIFISSNTKTVNQPYVSYKTEDGYSNPENNNSAISFITDSTAPVMESILFISGEGKSIASPSALMPDSVVVGGAKKRYVRFGIKATDTNGIKSVSLTGLDNVTFTQYKQNTDYWYSNEIDLQDAKYTEGLKTLTFEIVDNADISATPVQKRVTIDKSAPSVEIISPLKTDEVTGAVTITGTTSDEYSNIGIVKYLVLNNTYVTNSSNQTPDVSPESFGDCENKGSSLRSWKFVLNNLPSSDAELNAEENGYTNITHTEQNIYTLPIYFYVEDELGNGKVIKDKTIKYNPFGDRPTAEVTFPTSTKDSENKVTPANVNGAIRVTGSAQDNVSVKEVYIQLDVNNDGEFNSDDITILESCLDAGTVGNKVYTIKTATDYKTGEAANADLSAIGDEFWGIKVNGTNSWNYTINKFSELLKEGNKVDGAEGKYAVNIRAVAVDNNYKFGNWSETQYVEFDTNIPSIGKRNKNVKEYDSDGTTVKATKAYISDMYLKGTAALELSVEDKEGIKQVMYYVADTEEGLARATNGTIINNGEAKTWGSGATETKGYIVKIPLAEDSSASGTKYVKVVATKNSDTETTAYEKFCVNFDNKPPVINNITLNGVKHNDSDKKIVNSNGTYFTFGGSVTDEGNSGFDKVLFYYYREGKNGNPRIYDPMIDSTNSSAENSSNKDAGRVNVISGLPSRVLAEQTLYGTEQDVEIASDKRTFTISEDSHIRAGGVVEINGTWLTIEKIEGTTVTLKSDAPVTGSQKVFFAYAQVIDNTGSEKTDANGDLSTGDDGDGMAESIIKSLNTWTFDATFHSNYIPDGPGKLVVFAFDKAGNVSAGSYEASVQNNAPRLTRVMLATDLNDSGKYEYYSDSVEGPINNLSDKATANGTEFGEFAFYSTLNNKGEGSNIAEVTLPKGRDPFIVKNNLLVVPEFTGGNGELSYTYKIVDDLASAGITTITEGYSKKEFATSSNSKIVKKDGSAADFDASKSKEFELTNEDVKDYESWTSSGKKTRYLAATFWDTTEETTPGKDSCYALLKMPLIINVVDDTKPTATITPFYWNSKEDSSFVYDEDGNPLGHIDIPAENSTENPGVSGEVYIEGYAWDDTRLGELLITDPNGTEKKVASYEDGKWFGLEEPDEFGIWKINRDTANIKNWSWPDNWKSFEILEDYGIRQSGHTVKWRFRIDMTSYGLDKDKSVIVKAIDAQNNEMSNFDKGYTINNVTRTPTYIMDFVPYIKSIYSEDIGSATRSRLGKFPVRAGKDMIIEGMNFASNATYKVKFYKSNKLVNGKIPENTEADSTENATFVSDGKIRVTAPDYSLWVEVEVTPTGKTAVSTKNNSNQNGGYNIEAGYVAKANDKGLSQANTAGTKFWTDDRYISVWNVGDTFKGSENPIKGTIEKLMNGDKKYEASTEKTITTDNILMGLWGSEANMMYDAKLGGDRFKNVSNTDSGAFGTPPAEVDVCIVNGTPFYAILDDTWKDASTFGFGLMLLRDGHVATNNVGVVEKTEDDKVRDQFQNPKIAGVYTTSSDTTKCDMSYHMYVSYYDKHTHCLKYGKVEWNQTKSSDNNDRISNVTMNNKINTVIAGEDVVAEGDYAGEFSDIKVINNNTAFPTPIIVYYNKTEKCLYFAKGTETKAGESATWTLTKINNPSGNVDFGRYVSMEMDSSNGLHVVAQDANAGVLYYGYFSKVSSKPTIGWMKIDATSSVGRWTDIKLEDPSKTGLNAKPVITYMDSSKLGTTSAVKIAYYDSVSGSFDALTDPTIWEATDQKLSLAVTALDSEQKRNKYAVGINSTMFAVDFLRGED